MPEKSLKIKTPLKAKHRPGTDAPRFQTLRQNPERTGYFPDSFMQKSAGDYILNAVSGYLYHCALVNLHIN